MANDTLKFYGRLKSAYNVQDKDDNGNISKSTNIIALYRDGLTIETDGGTIEGDEVDKFFANLYANTAKKWVPDWFKEGKDFCQLKSRYNVQSKIEKEDRQLSFAEFVELGKIRGAEVVIKCNVKDNALYPNLMLIKDLGEPYDSFKNF